MMEGAFLAGAILLDKYRIESVLGRGGMGVVLRVTHLHVGEELAMKILSPDIVGDPDAHARFLREAQSAIRLRGEHVSRVGDVGMLPEGAPYIVMEYLRGADLAGELRKRGTLPPGEIVDYVLQACEALAEAHALGIVHRDIKPSNLFLTTRPDGTPLVKVLDFGISKAPLGGPGVLTRTDAVMGTPGYMSPEQMKASKDVDARTDVWSLGIVLYECLNGRRPFDAESYSAVVLRAANEPPPPMGPRIPHGLQSVVLRCLEKDRAARFQSMAALAAALAPFARDARAAAIITERTSVMLREPGTPAAPSALVSEPRAGTTLSWSAGVFHSSSRRRRFAAGGGIALLAAIAALSVVLVMTRARSSDSTSTSTGSGTNEANAHNGPPVTSHSTAPDITHAARPPATEAGSTSAGAERPHESSGSSLSAPATPDAAAATAPQPSPSRLDEKKMRKCAEAQVQRDWEALLDCAKALRALGATDKASELETKAMQEMRAAILDADARTALRELKLRDAWQLMQQIGNDSVYFNSLNDAISRVETAQAEDARRKAEAFAMNRDCAGLAHYVQALSSGGLGTARVMGVVSGVKCIERSP